VLQTARELAAIGKIDLLRAGIWKPRTRPNSFEGVGTVGLKWLKQASRETGLPVATEVANAKHVEECLEHEIDVLWVGARTSVNPFSVQEIADALKGVDIPVMVKNPINPDLQLWIGALERINNAGITRLAAIHRGFSSYEKSPFRNIPKWEIMIDLKSHAPDLPIICDPSHIAGNRALIPLIAQKAIDLDMAGLMIEAHISPKSAMSDKEQQVKPETLAGILNELTIRKPTVANPLVKDKLKTLRVDIDAIDEHLIELMSSRMEIARKIGTYKKDNNITILQLKRWDEIVNKRLAMGKAMGLSDIFLDRMLQLIHQESIRIQTEIMNEPVVSAK
jgi:chorismate mutase